MFKTQKRYKYKLEYRTKHSKHVVENKKNHCQKIHRPVLTNINIIMGYCNKLEVRKIKTKQ